MEAYRSQERLRKTEGDDEKAGVGPEVFGLKKSIW
jgi:hypothetical protein